METRAWAYGVVGIIALTLAWPLQVFAGIGAILAGGNLLTWLHDYSPVPQDGITIAVKAIDLSNPLNKTVVVTITNRRAEPIAVSTLVCFFEGPVYMTLRPAPHGTGKDVEGVYGHQGRFIGTHHVRTTLNLPYEQDRTVAAGTIAAFNVGTPEFPLIGTETGRCDWMPLVHPTLRKVKRTIEWTDIPADAEKLRLYGSDFWREKDYQCDCYFF